MSLCRFKRSDIWYSLLLVGMGAALAGLTAATIASRFIDLWLSVQNGVVTILPSFTVFYVAAPLASALLGVCLWWWAIIKPGRLSVRRGIGVGVLGATLAHPLAWYLALVLGYLTGETAVAGVLVNNPLLDIPGALILAPFSLLWVGWITALVGGIAGGVVALLQSKSGCSERWQASMGHLRAAISGAEMTRDH
jgi:hypothetical protein